MWLHSSGSVKADKQTDHLSFTPDENFSPPWGDHNVHVHFGVGCDFCGVRSYTLRFTFLLDEPS